MQSFDILLGATNSLAFDFEGKKPLANNVFIIQLHIFAASFDCI